MTLEGKVVIVTGSATGVGAAVALRLAQDKARIVINYSKSAAEAEETFTAVKAAGAEAIIVQGNVAEDVDCRALAQAAIDRWGTIHGLVNNAGTTKFADHADLEALTAEDFQRIYAVNVIGAYQMARACAPAMKTAGYGAIVNVSSIAGVRGIGSSIAYAASKGALNNLTMALGRALAPEIRVNAVCPGFIGTRWFRDRFGEEGFAKMIRQAENTTPLKRAGTPEDIAEPIVWLLGAGSQHITGETLLIDAGHHLMLSPMR